MTIHKCDVCCKEFQRIAHLQQHLARKNPCSPQDVDIQHEKPNQCGSCGKTFRFDSALSRHRHTCKGPRPTIDTLQSELVQLRAHVQQLTAGNSTTTTTGQVVNNIDNSVNNSNNVTNIHITLNNYGSESQDHLEALSYADLKRTLKLTPDHESLVRMIEFIHLNDAVPQNRTIRLDDKDSSVINVFKRGRWREQNADTVIYDLICRNRLRFVDLEEILSKNMAKNKFQELSQYLCKAEDMANSEKADLHLEYAFNDLMSIIREKVAA